MEYITWYTLLLKAWISKKTSWLMLMGVLLIVWTVSLIELPSNENTTVGVYGVQDAYSVRLMENLENMNSIFQFVSYEDEDALYRDIVSGQLECGFILDDHFELKTKNSDIEEIITYVCSPMTVKGEVIQETVFAAFLQLYGETILSDSEMVVYDANNEIRMQEIFRKYEYYLQNSRVFQLKTEWVDVAGESLNDINDYGTYPIQGLAGLLIFLMLWFSCGRKLEKNGCNVYAALNTRRKSIFEFCSYLAAATIPAVAVFILIIILTLNRGFWTELITMILFIIISCLWVLVLGKRFKNSTTFAAWALTLVLIQGLICPVFIDLAQYVPAIFVFRFLFPLGWYLI